MGNIQSDYYSEFGARLTPYLLEVGARLVEEYDAPGSHPVLTEVVAAHPGVQTQVESALALLESWNFYAEDGMWGEPTPDQVKASNATSLFNFWAVAAIRGAFLDEWTVVPSIGDQLRARALLWLLENPEQAATFDPDTGESALWDRLDTPGVVERRDAILAGALFVALAELETSFGSADSATWLWGKTHVKKFNTLVPIGAGNEYTWPQPGEGYDNGFPRHGDNYNVDACNGGLSDYSFGCGGVALQRLVAEATPEGIVSFNALPGGQVWDKTSPFFRNQLPTWLDNERRQSTLTPEQLLSDIHEHWVIQPSE
jgi:penicillin amidase